MTFLPLIGLLLICSLTEFERIFIKKDKSINKKYSCQVNNIDEF